MLGWCPPDGRARRQHTVRSFLLVIGTQADTLARLVAAVQRHVFQQRRATPVRRCRSGVMDRYTDIEHEHLDGDDDDGVEFRSQDEAGYGNGRDSDGVELRSEDELCYCTVQ
jgi:hypothetical protein